MTYEKCSSARRVQQRTPSTAHPSAATHTNCSSSHKVQHSTRKVQYPQKCNSARNVQQHTQRAATHAKCSSARKVQLRTLDVDGYHLNGTMIAFHHGNLGCASVSVCGKFTWSKLLVGTSPQYDRVIFCADARSNLHHDTNLGSCSGYA